MTRSIGLMLLLLAVALPACSGGRGSPSSPSPAQLQVGGAYTIVKSIAENTCDGNLTPGTVSGTVTHASAAQAFTMNDSFVTFSGTVQSNGAFTIPPTPTPPGHFGVPLTSVFEGGRFTTNGFEVQVRLDVNGANGQPPFPDCRVSQVWRGTKQGSPNVIPG